MMSEKTAAAAPPPMVGWRWMKCSTCEKHLQVPELVSEYLCTDCVWHAGATVIVRFMRGNEVAIIAGELLDPFVRGRDALHIMTDDGPRVIVPSLVRAIKQA